MTMIDPGTGLTILGSAVGGAKIIEKILGPTSEYIGEQIKEWAAKKIKNTANIFKNAEKKLGDRIDLNEQVPPKVLKGILEEGAWCEEELQIEYFGGVLASSRTGVSRDDRGAYFVSLISRLSTYQLRSHYLLYQLLKYHFNNKDINIHEGNKWSNLEIFIPSKTYFLAMDFEKAELSIAANVFTHSIWGLCKEELIHSGFMYGGIDHIKKGFKDATSDGLLFQPTQIGIELFMWAYGYGNKDPNDFFKNTILFPNDQDIIIGESVTTKN